MIQNCTILKVMDNSGAKEVMCFKVLKSKYNNQSANIGDIIKVSIKSLKDKTIIDILINNENMYSAFPWPKLWSLSFGSLEILFPIKVISEAKISPALFTLSAIIAWLPLINPTVALITNKNIFPKIPKIPAFLVAVNLSIKSPNYKINCNL